MTRGAVDAGDDAGVEFGGLGGELRDTLLHGGAEFTGQVRWRRAGGQESVLCHLFAEERAVELFFAFEEQAGEAVTGDEDVERDFAEGHNIGGWFESEFPPREFFDSGGGVGPDRFPGVQDWFQSDHTAIVSGEGQRPAWVEWQRLPTAALAANLLYSAAKRQRRRNWSRDAPLRGVKEWLPGENACPT